MVETLGFRLKARNLLFANPLLNALPIHRVFHTPVTENHVLVDRLQDPRALMTIGGRESKFVSMVGRNEESVAELLDSLERGKEYRFHAIDSCTADLVRESFDVLRDNPSWFYILERKDFVGEVRHEVSALVPEDAETIDQYWNPGEDTASYVRSRIEDGPAFGIRVDGELVAWDATHLETDEAVMLGFLYVKEEHRHRGFAKSMAAKMIGRVFEKGKTPVCHIFTDNEPAIRLTEEMGFRRRGEQVWLRAVKP
ncbi:MAG: GNAT family N-acetyltransferase [Thermoplasmata archaeon]